VPTTITNDTALAIAEEAFRAGFEAGVTHTEHPSIYDGFWWTAWCEFEPSEAIKDLTT
jgi:hypothetical protein